MNPARWIALLGAVATLIVASFARATVIDTVNFTEEPPWMGASGYRTAMAWAPDGSNRLFTSDKEGAVHIFRWGPPATLVTFATITPVYTAGECGVTGLAFDPNFQVTGYIYFFVTVSATEQQIIRYTAVGDVGTDKTIILAGLPTAGANHDGGAIGFGPDGKLYWAIGDLGNGTGVNADLSSLAAKVGRANPDGTVPNDNPFFDGIGPNDDFIWARGMRNPFTLTFQPTNGALWVNVVGTNYEQVFVVGKGDHAGYNAYENNQPNGFITPVIKYRTNGVDTFNLATGGAVRASDVVTFTTTAAHGFRLGEKIDIAGVADTSFNGAIYVTSTPTPTTFTTAQVGPNATSDGGTATTQNLGGCVTGGTFYDGTQFGPAYQGNFFFADYNSGRVMRVVLGSGNTVTSVDTFATGIPLPTDTSIGPDGALYYQHLNGYIYRTRFNTSMQALVLSGTHVWMMEGGQTSVSVSLAVAPTADVTVNVARTAGDPDVGVLAGAALTFTPANWRMPQAVTFAAADDLDTARDTATIAVTSSGLTTESIIVNVIDDDANNFLVSRAALPIAEGGSGIFTVALAAAPSATLIATVARAAGDPDVSVTGGATLSFDAANFAVPQTVTISAAEDADATDDIATISVTATGLVTRTVAVTATDNEPAAPLITSTPRTAAVVNAPYTYAVVATGLPTPSFSLTSPPTGMTIGAGTGIITWAPAAQGSFPVTVVVTNGVAPDATQAFTIVVGPDLAPTCALTRPVQNEIVAGKGAEFFGDGFDDVGTTRAEFFVDGRLAYTDVNTVGHYHLGGAHNLWDTTALSEGAHKAKMVITDTIGQKCEKEVAVTVTNDADGGTADGGTPDASIPPDSGALDVARDVLEDMLRDANGDLEAATRDGGEDAVDRDVRPNSGPTDATDNDTARGDGERDAGDAGPPHPDDQPTSDCGCRMGRRYGDWRAAVSLIMAFVGWATWRRRRRGQACRALISSPTANVPIDAVPRWFSFVSSSQTRDTGWASAKDRHGARRGAQRIGLCPAHQRPARVHVAAPNPKPSASTPKDTTPSNESRRRSRAHRCIVRRSPVEAAGTGGALAQHSTVQRRPKR